MPTRNQVEQWSTATLNQLAQHLGTTAGDFETQLGRMVTQFSDTTWQGKAHDAASDRFSQENTDDRRLAQEIRDLGTAIGTAATRLANERRVLLAKVADAEHDTTAPSGLTVNDKWQVQTKLVVLKGVTEDQLHKIKERIDHHQGLINAAYNSLTGAVDEQTQLVNNAAEKVVARGELIARGIDAPTLSAADIAEYGSEDPAATAAQDIQAFENGTATKEQIERVKALTNLTPSQLQALKDGQPVNISDNQFKYLQGLTHAASTTAFAKDADFRDLPAIADIGSKLPGDEQKTVQTGLANAMQMVSNPKISADGGLQGGMKQLPAEMQKILQYNPADSKGPFPAMTNADQYKALATIAGRADSDLAQGTDLDRGVLKQGAEIAALHDGPYPQFGYDPGALSNSMLDTASRDHQAVSDFISGNNMSSTVSPGGTYNADQHVMDVFAHQWQPDQHGAQNMFKWIGEDATNPDPALSGLAGHTGDNLAHMLARNSDTLVHNLPGHDGNSLGAVNPELTKTLAGTMAPYIGNFAGLGHGLTVNNAAGPFTSTHELGNMFSVLDSDPTAAKTINNAASQWRDYMAMQAGMHPEISDALGKHAAQLGDAMHQGLQTQMDDIKTTDNWHATENYNQKSNDYDTTTRWVNALPGVSNVPSAVLGQGEFWLKQQIMDAPGDPTHPIKDNVVDQLQQLDKATGRDTFRQDFAQYSGYASTHPGTTLDNPSTHQPMATDWKSVTNPQNQDDFTNSYAEWQRHINNDPSQPGLSFDRGESQGSQDDNIMEVNSSDPSSHITPPHAPK